MDTHIVFKFCFQMVNVYRYSQAFRKQKMPDDTRDHFKAITLKPQLYAEHLRDAIGFSSVETLRSADMTSADEFDRSVLLCTK